MEADEFLLITMTISRPLGHFFISDLNILPSSTELRFCTELCFCVTLPCDVQTQVHNKRPGPQPALQAYGISWVYSSHRPDGTNVDGTFTKRNAAKKNEPTNS